jgi:GTP pyrophosphokinase
MLRFNDIADRMLEYNPACDLALLQRAYVYSAKVHEGQERLSGEPYLVHPLEVAGILVETRMDEVTVAAGLLHDTLEDTLVTAEELRRLFGENVAYLVEGLTKIAKIEFRSQQERQAENFRKLLVAMSRDIRILLIKLADRLHNMRTLQHMSEESRRRVAQETLDIYAPLAHRLGIQWMQRELEELAFRALQPGAAEELLSKLASKRAQRESYVEEVIGNLGRRLAEAGLCAEVTGRLKELVSIYAKMQSHGVTLDEIYDVIAFRVILDGPREQVYSALGHAHSIWRPVPGRFKDYVALPKPNGYQSLHTTVIGDYGERMEVQIRTAEMHRNAEFGIAAHWVYKQGKAVISDEDQERFGWLRQLLEYHQELKDPHEFLHTVKLDLFPGDVFVFTPQGDVIDLPVGATPVDFAYAIHSEVGAHCAGAKVNGALVPLRHQLSDGDTVEIVTSDAQVPRKDWLEFVVSSRAKNKIRAAVRARDQDRSLEIGRELLSRELRRVGLSLERLSEQRALDPMVAAFKRSSVDDLFAGIGYGRVPVAEVVRRLRGEEPEPAPAPKPERRGLFRRKAQPSKAGLRVEGQTDVLVRMAHCCGPLPGDEVVGFVTRGRGVTVHASDCPRAFELDPARRIAVEWNDQVQEPRLVKIRVHTLDQQGMLAKVTKSISAAQVNIGAAKIATRPDGTAVHTFDLWVPDVSALNGVMKEIRRVRGVMSAERVRT